jgi:hypothetical protein
VAWVAPVRGDDWDYVTGVASDGGGGVYFVGKSKSKASLTVGTVGSGGSGGGVALDVVGLYRLNPV